jgi:two-component system, OmpR family, aerobic respiration control sensor histidine kinase ArcB
MKSVKEEKFPFSEEVTTYQASAENILAMSYVLLVEDDKLTTHVMQSILKNLNCSFDIAMDGASALLLLQHNQYDLLFIDVGLPDISGNEVTKKIRDREARLNIHTPIVGLTAHTDKKRKQQCIKAGMDAVLSKPLSIKTASDILTAFIPKRIEKLRKLFDLPSNIIDLELGATTIGKDIHHAKEMIAMLIDSFPQDLLKVREAYEQGDWCAIQHVAHKLYGATCYCGTPRLNLASLNLDKYLEEGKKEFRDKLYLQMLEEIAAVKKEWE